MARRPTGILRVLCMYLVMDREEAQGGRGAPRTDKERCMKRRPKVLFHASVGWMDRGSYCFGDFSPPEIFSEFSGKSLIFLRPREEYRVAIRKVVPLFLPLGGEGMSDVSPLPRPDATRKKRPTTFAPRDIFQLNVV